MGCAPSIRVSQRTGVVYCRDNIKETSRSSIIQQTRPSKRLSSASLSISEVVSHIPSGHRESLTTEVRITHYQAGGKRDSLITTTTTTQAWVSAEDKQTQAQRLFQGMDKVSRASYSTLLFFFIYFLITHPVMLVTTCVLHATHIVSNSVQLNGKKGY